MSFERGAGAVLHRVRWAGEDRIESGELSDQLLLA